MFFSDNLILNFRKTVIRLFIIQIFFVANSHAQSNAKSDSLLQVYGNANEDTNKVNLADRIYKELYNTGDFKRALEYANQQFVLAQKLKFQTGIASGYYNIGLAQQEMNLINESIINLKKAEQIFILLKDTNKVASSYNSLGSAYNRLDKYSEALSYHINALKLREMTGDRVGLAQSYSNIGVIYKNQKRYDDAIDSYNKALKLREELKDKRGISTLYQRLGVVSSEKDDYQPAIEYYKKALEISQEIKDKNGIAFSNQYIGLTMRDAAIKKWEHGDTANSKIKFNMAIKHLNTALEYKIKNESDQGIANIYNGLGVCYLYLNEYDKAEDYLEMSAAIAKKSGSIRLQKYAYRNLFKLDTTIAANNPDNSIEKIHYLNRAIEHMIVATNLNDSLFNENNTKQIAEIKTKYETEKKDNEIALLNKEKDLQLLRLKQQQAALLISKLSEEKTKTEIEFLNKTKDFQELKLSKTQQELFAQMLEAKAQKADLELEKRDKALKEEQLGKERLYRSIFIGGSLALLFISMLLFNRYRLNKKVEQQKVLINHRKQISADLHDDIGSTLSSISIYSEAMKNKYRSGDYDKALQLAEEIGKNSREMMENMSDIVWSINPGQDNLQQICNRMQSVSTSLLSQKEIVTEFLMDDKLSTLLIPMQARKNIYLIFKEAINNIAKYAQCKNVTVQLLIKNKNLILKISDDGKGFDTTMLHADHVNTKLGGNGLKNMQVRADEIKGDLKIKSIPNKGTEIMLTYPLFRG